MSTGHWPPVRAHVSLFFAAVLVLAGTTGAAETWKVVGWNDLGMHCMDSDYSVFSILPPFNTIHAQVIDTPGQLVTDPAAADPSGSINASSANKTNFWNHAGDFYGVSLPVDQDLTGTSMPGAENQLQPMLFESDHDWFTAEGIPLTSFDDGYRTNFYLVMRLVLRNAQGTMLATTDVVLPVSMEMSCRS